MKNQERAVFTPNVLEENKNLQLTFIQEPRILLIKSIDNKIYAKVIDWDTKNEGDLGWTDQELEKLQEILSETRKQMQILSQALPQT
jgi:hypothetical protein